MSHDAVAAHLTSVTSDRTTITPDPQRFGALSVAQAREHLLRERSHLWSQIRRAEHDLAEMRQAVAALTTMLDATAEHGIGALPRVTAGREHEALLLLNSGECEHSTSGIGSCFRDGRTADSEYGADRACASCVAFAALTGRKILTGKARRYDEGRRWK